MKTARGRYHSSHASLLEIRSSLLHELLTQVFAITLQRVIRGHSQATDLTRTDEACKQLIVYASCANQMRNRSVSVSRCGSLKNVSHGFSWSGRRVLGYRGTATRDASLREEKRDNEARWKGREAPRITGLNLRRTAMGPTPPDLRLAACCSPSRDRFLCPSPGPPKDKP
jgi:hypothetical protein